jgi:2,4-dienoyl-CoA reductase-like NADH-dependent reductase (Old Yellow Enzyme family)
MGMEMDLGTPIEIRGVKVRNRIVLPPMATELATVNGEVTEDIIKHYDERSRGPGIVIVEHSYVALNGKVSQRQLGIYSEKLVEGLRRLAETIRGNGAIAIIQLNHGGGRSSSKITGEKPIAPSAIKLEGWTEEPREMTLKDFIEVKEAFKRAADIAVKAGFHGVEIHGAHGFLLNQFTSPITNRRLDAYGGTFEKRIRFPLEIVEEVRRVIGGGRILSYRIGADDMMPGGVTIEESMKFAVKLEECGVDVINVSGGLCGSRPQNLTGQGYFIPLAEKIKSKVKIPVIGVGGIRDPDYANNLIKSGRVDLVAVGRAMLEDPKWAEKALEKIKSKTT